VTVRIVPLPLSISNAYLLLIDRPVLVDAGEVGTRRLTQLFRVWCEQKHSHIQFNVLNRQSLLDAQKHPEHYRDLVVRIAGHCAYFVDLSPAQQAEIIART
jgi:pyruvate-formate lyase